MSEYPIGPSWHESPQKHLFDAQALNMFAYPAQILTGMTALLLAFENKWPFEQERIGYDGKSFMLPKLQTLECTDIPYGRKIMVASPLGEFVQKMALDELIGLTKVSGDPDNPGPLSVVGRRPLMPETLESMRSKVPDRFDDWFENIYCRMRPGVFGLFGTLRAKKYLPFSREYYTASMASDYWYFHNASEVVDQKILYCTFLVGCNRLGMTPNLSKETSNFGTYDVFLTLAKPEPEAHNHN